MIAALPVYVIMLNLFGFLTLPLYAFTPEAKLSREVARAYQNKDFEHAGDLADEFVEKYAVNVPEQSPGEE